MIRLTPQRFHLNFNLIFGKHIQCSSNRLSQNPVTLQTHYGIRSFCTKPQSTFKHRSDPNLEAITRITSLYTKDIENLIVDAQKKSFQTKNKSQIETAEKFVKQKFATNVRENDLPAFSKFVNIVSQNEDLQSQFVKIVVNKQNPIYLPQLIELSWYVCLAKNAEDKAAFFTHLLQLLKTAMPKDFSKKFIFHYKVKMTQVLFNLRLFAPNSVESTQLFDSLETFEHIALEDFSSDFYQIIVNLLASEGIQVETLGNFNEIYNTGIELQGKTLLNFFQTSSHEESTNIYKAIKYENLKKLGYHVVPIFVDMNKLNHKALIGEIVEKVNKSKNQEKSV